MAIDPKELRIGSHVMVDGVRREVFGLGCGRVSYLSNPLSSVAESVLADKVEPIPITPELLTELGFEYRDKIYWEHWFKGGFDIERDKDSKYFDYSSELRLEYLHELENLYYMIYGVELITD